MLVAELNRTRRIGCEFEMAVPLVGLGSGADVQSIMAEILGKNGITAISRPYDNSPLPRGVIVAIEHDSSITGENIYNGIKWVQIEVKTKILEGIDDWERVVPKTLEICSYLGARVNKSTGFHIHLDLPEVRDKPTIIKSLFNLFYRFEPVIFGLVAPSRTNNDYTRAISFPSGLLNGCKSIRSFLRAFRPYHEKSGLNLTHLFSLNSLAENPRIEIRYHHGILDVEKARHWTRFCLQMVQHSINRNIQSSQQVPNTRQGLENLLISCGFKPNNNVYSKVCPELRDTGKYLISRWKHFNGDISLKSSKFSLF